MRFDRLAQLRATLLVALALAHGCGGGPDTDDTEPPFAGCEDPVAILDGAGQESGFVTCADGTVNRDREVACDPTFEVVACGTTITVDPATTDCVTDAECGGAQCIENPYSQYRGAAPEMQCVCAAPCATDADCGSGKVCVCGGTLKLDDPWSQCVTAACATGDDCASGECGASQANNGCGWYDSLACRDDDDACRSDDECGDGKACTHVPADGGWACREDPYAVCGRPLLVEGRARAAAPTARADWLAPISLSADADVAAALARHWAEIGAMEHASIASFARFTLQLMALGAPPALLADTQRAAADEVEHARLAYGLAAAYGSPVGPAALPLAGLSLDVDRRAVLAGLVEEACVGETVSVAECKLAADLAVDPDLRAVLARIADDEERHAALAWRTLAWLLQTADDADRAYVADRFRHAIAEARAWSADRVHLPDHGVLGGEALTRLRARALDAVVVPCAEAVLGTRLG